MEVEVEETPPAPPPPPSPEAQSFAREVGYRVNAERARRRITEIESLDPEAQAGAAKEREQIERKLTALDQMLPFVNTPDEELAAELAEQPRKLEDFYAELPRRQREMIDRPLATKDLEAEQLALETRGVVLRGELERRGIERAAANHLDQAARLAVEGEYRAEDRDRVRKAEMEAHANVGDPALAYRLASARERAAQPAEERSDYADRLASARQLLENEFVAEAISSEVEGRAEGSL